MLETSPGRIFRPYFVCEDSLLNDHTFSKLEFTIDNGEGPVAKVMHGGRFLFFKRIVRYLSSPTFFTVLVTTHIEHCLVATAHSYHYNTDSSIPSKRSRLPCLPLCLYCILSQWYVR
jgi:hypothetical protein